MWVSNETDRLLRQVILKGEPDTWGILWTWPRIGNDLGSKLFPLRMMWFGLIMICGRWFGDGELPINGQWVGIKSVPSLESPLSSVYQNRHHHYGQCGDTEEIFSIVTFSHWWTPSPCRICQTLKRTQHRVAAWDLVRSNQAGERDERKKDRPLDNWEPGNQNQNWNKNLILSQAREAAAKAFW